MSILTKLLKKHATYFKLRAFVLLVISIIFVTDNHLYEGLSDEIPESENPHLPDYVNTKMTEL